MQRKNTICFLNTVKKWGGGEKWHLDVASHLQSIGHPIILYVSPQSELARRAVAAGLPVREVKLGKYSYLNPIKISRLRRYFASDQVDTIIMNLSSDMKAGGLAARNGHVRRVIYRRGSAIPIKNTLINRWILQSHISEILANSQATVETVFENNQHIFDRDRVTVIPNGIDIPPADQVNQRIPSTLIRIGNVGRLYRQKAQHYLIDLAIELRTREVEFVIDIVGEGVERQRLTQLISDHGLQECVNLQGFKDDLREFYQSIDVFVLTSVWEGFGYVLAEAMSYGVPAVAFDISSNPELIDDGYNGHLVPFDDIKALASSVLSIAENRQHYSQAARLSMEEKYSKPLILAKVESYLIGH